MDNNEPTTSSTIQADGNLPLRLQAWFKILLCTLYSVIFTLGVGGNAAVCFTMYQRKKLKTVTNLFVLNLAISDLIFSGSIPLEFPLILSDYTWPYAPFFCKLYGPVQTIAVSVSIFTLTAVSVIRYRAINHPMKRQVSRGGAKRILIAIWIFSLFLMIPHFLTLQMKGDTCDEEWPHVLYRKFYTTLLFGFFYAVPLIIMVLAYAKIVKELKKGDDYHNTASNETRAEETRKVIRMLIIVTFVFAVCNLPSQLVWLWLDYGNAEKMFPYFFDLQTTLNIFIFANSAANPLIYYIYLDKFRHEVQSYLKRCGSLLGRLKGHKERIEGYQCHSEPLWFGKVDENVEKINEIGKLDHQRLTSLDGISMQLISSPIKLQEVSVQIH